VAKKKSQDIRIKVAIIGAIGAIIAAYVGSPFLNSQYTERPIIDISFGANNTYPKSELQNDSVGYYVDLFVDNRGKSDGKIILEVNATNAKVQLVPSLLWANDQSLRFTVPPTEVMKTHKIYVLPDSNATEISIQLHWQDVQDKPQFQEFNPNIPLELIYHKSGNAYKLVAKVAPT